MGHVVDSTRWLQTVERHVNARYWQLINAFKQETGVPVVLNTSFNENEPIVCTSEEAISCFVRTKMDALAITEWAHCAIRNFLVEKSIGWMGRMTIGGTASSVRGVW